VVFDLDAEGYYVKKAEGIQTSHPRDNREHERFALNRSARKQPGRDGTGHRVGGVRPDQLTDINI
jgi:hypothetical protein